MVQSCFRSDMLLRTFKAMLLDVGLNLLGMNICKGPASGFKEVLILTIYFQTGRTVRKKLPQENQKKG